LKLELRQRVLKSSQATKRFRLEILNCNSEIRPVFMSSAFGQRNRADLGQNDF